MSTICQNYLHSVP